MRQLVCGLLMVLAISLGTDTSGAAPPTSAENDAAAPVRCGFYRVSDHEVTFRQGLTCEEAKAVLRKLRDSRDFVPMACGRDRTVGGWKLHNLRREWTSLQSSYRKGDQVIHYFRSQSFENVTCPPVDPDAFDEPDA